MIQRYESANNYGDFMLDTPNGAYVLYDEHALAMAQQRRELLASHLIAQVVAEEKANKEIDRLASIISGLQSTLEYVRAQTLQALDIDWAGPEEEPAEAVSKQYLDGLEDIKTALSNV